MTVRILHTSDWHLGQNLMNKDRKREHERFLDWLIDYMALNLIDVLIVAGDIFDSSTPPNYALRLYFNFLRRIADTGCGLTVIIGGNHDSVSTLHASRELLELFRVHVIGGIGSQPGDEIIVAKDTEGRPMGIVCAVPFLRDRDIRQSVAGESYEEKSRALLDGVKNHYREVKNEAILLRESFHEDGKNVPLIATGHLFTAGGVTSDGVRDIYVGSLGQILASSFPEEFDYIALGHLHRPQNVDSTGHIRYSGSPIPLSFSEVGAAKQVVVIDADKTGSEARIEAVKIPEFQKLCCIKGDLDRIEESFKSLEFPEDGAEIWVEIQVDTDEWVPDIQNRIAAMTTELPLEVLAIKNVRQFGPHRLQQSQKQETLQELSPTEVFRKRIQMEEGIEEDSENLLQAFNEILNRVGSIAAEGAE